MKAFIVYPRLNFESIHKWHVWVLMQMKCTGTCCKEEKTNRVGVHCKWYTCACSQHTLAHANYVHVLAHSAGACSTHRPQGQTKEVCGGVCWERWWRYRLWSSHGNRPWAGCRCAEVEVGVFVSLCVRMRVHICVCMRMGGIAFSAFENTCVQEQGCAFRAMGENVREQMSAG
jgi:hypothetical protein